MQAGSSWTELWHDENSPDRATLDLTGTLGLIESWIEDDIEWVKELERLAQLARKTEDFDFQDLCAALLFENRQIYQAMLARLLELEIDLTLIGRLLTRLDTRTRAYQMLMIKLKPC